MINKRSIGNAYEEQTVAFLKSTGIQILDRNFYTKFGEIDIVAKEENYLCFVEVKYRKNAYAGDPLESVTLMKQKKISNSARYYLLTHPRYQGLQIRFDVVAILGDEVNFVRNAFSYMGAQ